MFKLPRKSDQVTMNNALLKACYTHTHSHIRPMRTSGSNCNLTILLKTRNAIEMVHSKWELTMSTQRNATEFSSSHLFHCIANSLHMNTVGCACKVSCRVENISNRFKHIQDRYHVTTRHNNYNH